MSTWPVVSVKELADPNAGAIAIGPFGSRMKADCYVDSGVPVIRGTNITGGRTFRGEFVYVSEAKADELSSSNVFAGDLVFPHRGAIGEVGIVPDDVNERYVLSTSMMKLSPDLGKVEPLFLFYFFRSPAGRWSLLKNASQVGTPGIATPLKSLGSVRVPLPPIDEQRAIARALGALDDKIELNRKMNRTLEEIARTLFRAWFVDFEGETDLVASELGPIPRGWETVPLGEEFRLTMGQSPPGSTYNEDREGLPFYQGATDFGFRYPEIRVFCTDPKRVAEAGDTLVSVRAPVGRVNRAAMTCCIGRGVAALRHRSGSESYTYMAAMQLEERFDRFNAEGTVFGSIGKKDFLRIPVIRPPAEAVERFTQVVEPLDRRIQAAIDQSRTLADLRDTLLPKLISGEIRVPEAEAALEEAV